MDPGRLRQAEELTRARVFVLSALTALFLGAPADGASLDYLYIEPNVGVASGGHVALRVDEFVYHYQHAGGRLVLSREHFEHFRYVYGVLQNRTIHVARLDVDADARERLRTRFNTRSIVQGEHLAVQRALRDDRLLLGLELAERKGVALAPGETLALRGAGFFFAPGSGGLEGSAPRLEELRDRVRRERGEDFLRERRAAVDRALLGLSLPGAFPEVGVLEADRLPARAYGWSERAVDLTLQRLALEVLERSPALRPQWRVDAPLSELRLDEAERETLRGFALEQERHLLALLDSPRPDWGYPLLVGLARQVVLDASIRNGRLVFLDAFPAGARAISAAGPGRRSGFLAELLAWAGAEFEAERALLFAAPRIRERDYAALEDAANRFVETFRGVREGRAIRVHGEHLVPHGELAQAGPLHSPAVDDADLHRAFEDAARRERGHAKQLEALYRYDLFTRNCSTEIFETINGSFGADELEQRMGGRIEPAGSLHFWPRLAFAAVKDSYRVAEVAEIPSFRRTRVGQMSAGGQPLLVRLREGNTLTSTLYRQNPSDSLFLFFTDDMPALRPLYGVANLAAGLGQTAWGLLRLPFDRGHSLVQGAKGMFFSFPELAFVNIRKGSFEYARGSLSETPPAPPVRSPRP